MSKTWVAQRIKLDQQAEDSSVSTADRDNAHRWHRLVHSKPPSKKAGGMIGGQSSHCVNAEEGHPNHVKYRYNATALLAIV